MRECPNRTGGPTTTCPRRPAKYAVFAYEKTTYVTFGKPTCRNRAARPLPANLSPVHQVLTADPIRRMSHARPANPAFSHPDTISSLALKLESLLEIGVRLGITRTPVELLRELLGDAQRVEQATDDEWISASDAAQLAGVSTERLRQLKVDGHLPQQGTRYRRGDIRARFGTRRSPRIAPTRLATQDAEAACPAPGTEATIHVQAPPATRPEPEHAAPGRTVAPERSPASRRPYNPLIGIPRSYSHLRGNQ